MRPEFTIRCGSPGSIRMPVRGSSVSSICPDHDGAASLEDHERMLGGRVAMPLVHGAGGQLDLAQGERRAAELAGPDQQSAAQAVAPGQERRGASRNGLRVVDPAAQQFPQPAWIGLGRGEQRERIGGALVAHEVAFRRRLVEHVAGADDRPPLELLAVLEDDLAGSDIDEGLDAVPVRPDLDARRDAVELQLDGHPAPLSGRRRRARRAGLM